MADPEPPQPLPFPIRIVSDIPPAQPLPLDDMQPAPPADPLAAKSDSFYPAWDRFLCAQNKLTKASSRETRKLEEEKSKVEDTQPDGLETQENAATSWKQAAEECRTKVAAIVEECYRLNQKYRDAIFDLEANPYCLQSLSGQFPKAVNDIEAPPWIKRVEDIFDKPQFFIDGATATDVHQGSGGDCWFLAALMAVSAKKELIENLCVARDEKVGVYGFVFYRDGEWIYEVIDDKLYMRVGDDDNIKVVRDWSPEKKEGMSLKHDEDKLKEQLQNGGEALYFSHCKSNETWLPLIEKAYAKAHGDYSSIEGGFASEGIEDLTGGVAVVINPEDIMDKERFWREQLSQVNEKYLFGGGSKNTASKGFVGGHAYTVLETFEEGDLKLLKLRNPWGEVEWEGDWSDGSKKWTPELMVKLKHTFGDDGVFWISYKDFLKHFPNINRVRLFNDEWTVAQQWTCVNVPWAVDYLDTRFELNVTQKGPIVIVLSQPDDRYFYGLRGRYLYSLHFRLYRQGEDEEGGRYLVRSMHNSGSETVFTRSVSAEMSDLEPGKYSVIFKITAQRTTQSTHEEAILKYAISNKEKLLHVGRRFDYAQTKGNLRAMEKANRREKREARKEKQKKGWKRDRRLNMQLREKERARKKRIDDAMKEKKKAVDEKERDKRRKRRALLRERRAERRARRGDGSDDAHASVGAEGSSEGKYIATPGSEESFPSKKHEESDTTSTPLKTVEKDGEKDGETSDRAEGSTKTAGIEQGEQKFSEPTEAPITDHNEIQGSEPVGAITEEVSSANAEDDPTHPPETKQVDPTVPASSAKPPTRSNDTDQPSKPNPKPSADELADPLAKLSISNKKQDKKKKGKGPSAKTSSLLFSRRSRSPSSQTSSSESDTDSDYESPPEQVEELEDDDFEWDSEIDGPVDSDTSSTSTIHRRSKLDIFASDPWNAVCVLGLRVYSKGEVGIRVVKGQESRED